MRCWYTTTPVLFNNPHDALSQACLNPVLEHFFNPLITLLRIFSGKDESPLCIVPVSFSVLPEHGIVPFIVILPKLLMCDFYRIKPHQGKLEFDTYQD